MKNKQNFILILADQWRGDCLGSLGHPDVETPHLDHIASVGMTFTNAYTAAPSCIPARVCLATGQTPSSCGRLGYKDGVPWRYEDTLMSVLRDNGYQTMNAGKTHFYPQRANLGFEQNYLYDPQNLEGDFKSDYHIWLEKETNGKVRDAAIDFSNNSWAVHLWTHDINLHPNTWTVSKAIEVLERRDPTRPFFLQVGLHRPHPPYDPPVEFFNMYRDKKLSKVPIGDWTDEYNCPVKNVDNADYGQLPEHVLERARKAYFAQITHLDYQIGRLYWWLRNKKMLDSTTIIFTSDHGELLGDHYLYRKIKPFEGSAKIPFIVMPALSIDCLRDQKNDLPISHMDIMPTVLDAASVDIPSSVEGQSLEPLLNSKETKWRDFIHGEHSYVTEGWQFVTDGKEKFCW